MTKEEIIKIIEDKQKEHESKYEQFKKDNVGYVMNGHAIKAETCNEILILIKDEKGNN